MWKHSSDKCASFTCYHMTLNLLTMQAHGSTTVHTHSYSHCTRMARLACYHLMLKLLTLLVHG